MLRETARCPAAVALAQEIAAGSCRVSRRRLYLPGTHRTHDLPTRARREPHISLSVE
jgi:hypothetical protein